VDYRHLGAEELGSVFESLLKMIPRCDPITQTVSLEATAGTDSKTSGSYCTPTELVELVLDTALDNVLDDAEKQPDPEAALLGMTACDPAIGSGLLSRYCTPHRQLACHGFVRVRSTRPQTMLQDADARRGRWLNQGCGHQPDGFLSGTSTSVWGS
jgi:hypothetical protein